MRYVFSLIYKKVRCTLILSILFVASAVSFSQNYKISGFVTDSENGQELPYASIMVVNHAIGISSDKNGFFELLIPDSLKNGTLVVSYVGYTSQHISIIGFVSDAIFLVPQNINLAEVVIKASSKKKELIVLNQFNKNDCSVRYTNDPFNGRGNLNLPYRAKEPSIESIYFAYNPDYESEKKIKEILVYLKSYKPTPTFCRLRIFNSTDSLTPGNDLLTDPVNVTVTDGSQLLKINIEKYNLTFTKPGIFIGMELLIVPENAREFKNNLSDVTTIYSPFLYYASTKEIGYKYWLYSGGKWINQSQAIPDYTKQIKNLYYKPAISLVLYD